MRSHSPRRVGHAGAPFSAGLGLSFEGGLRIVGGQSVLRRLVIGLVLLLAAGCSGNDGATTTSGETGTSDGVTTFPMQEPVGDIVAQGCPVPQEWLHGAPPVLGVCAYFPVGVFGAARVPATPDLMPEFVAGSECLLLWSDTGSDRSLAPTCYAPGSEPSQPQFGGLWDDADHGYTYVAVLVPEGTTRVVASTTDGTDLVAVPSQGIALLWWPGGAALANLQAETPSGAVELGTG